jgi:hypothetical protein
MEGNDFSIAPCRSAHDQFEDRKGTVLKRLALRCAAALLAAHMGLAAAGEALEPATEEARTEPTRTGKERLSSKAKDEQRVDNCKVPPELRGSKARPDCGPRPSTARTH